MNKITIELPDDALFFPSEDAYKLWKKDVEKNNYIVISTPQQFPCYIINRRQEENPNGKDFICFTTIYPVNE